LIYYGDYDKALFEIEKSDENEIDLLILESITYRNKSMFKSALNVAQEALERSIESKDLIRELGAFILVIFNEIFIDTKSREECQDQLNQFNEKYNLLSDEQRNSAQVWQAYYYHILGINSFWNFDHVAALDYTKQSLKIRETIEPPLGMLVSLNNICSIYNQLQNFDKLEQFAKEFFEKSEHNQKFQGWAYIYLGLVEMSRGDYDQSIKKLNKSLEIAKQLNHQFSIQSAYGYFGVVEEYFNNYEKAISYYTKSARIKEETNQSLALSRDLYSLVILNIRLGNEKSANRLVSKLKGLVNTHAEIKYRKKLANALIHKNKKRSKHKTIAQNLFEEIIHEDIKRPDISIEARLHLSELLLDEWRYYGEDEVLIHVNELIASIYEIAQELERIPLLIDVLLLRSKFTFLRMDLDLSLKLLEQARLLAEENQLDFKIPQIQKIEEEFQIEVEAASVLSRKGYKIQERLDKSRIIEYIEEMQSKIRVGN
jgi:tetratricopeptide (TPR) repeat protein